MHNYLFLEFLSFIGLLGDKFAESDVRVKNSSKSAMCEAIAYCCNAEKIRTVPSAVLGLVPSPDLAFNLNKFLHHQSGRKRLFKGYVLSMETSWPEQNGDCAEYEVKMGRLMDAAMRWWGDQGFQTVGAVHSNTTHPHFHLVLDTCNVLTGKQFSQPPKLLSNFKSMLTRAMISLRLYERVRQDIGISLEELFAEDDYNDKDAWLSRDDMTDSSSADKTELSFWFQDFDWSMSFLNPVPDNREMCHNIEHPHRRELCRIVEKPHERELCYMIDNKHGKLH